MQRFLTHPIIDPEISKFSTCYMLKKSCDFNKVSRYIKMDIIQYLSPSLHFYFRAYKKCVHFFLRQESHTRIYVRLFFSLFYLPLSSLFIFLISGIGRISGLGASPDICLWYEPRYPARPNSWLNIRPDTGKKRIEICAIPSHTTHAEVNNVQEVLSNPLSITSNLVIWIRVIMLSVHVKIL